MDLIENIKEFLKIKGLNWTGEVSTRNGKNFRLARVEDFKYLKNADYIIDFGKDGQIALSMEIDEITFKIYGESFDVGFTCYAGHNDKNIKLVRKLEDKDFSKEFIKFQLEKCGLVYATLLRKKCEEKKQEVEENEERRIGQLTRKIDYLNKSIQSTKEDSKKKIQSINRLEKLASEYETDI